MTKSIMLLTIFLVTVFTLALSDISAIDSCDSDGSCGRIDLEKRSPSSAKNNLDQALEHLKLIKMDDQRKCVQNRDLFYGILQGINPDKISYVTTDYTGIHLGDYQKSSFFKLIELFENGDVLHEFYVNKIIHDANAILKKMPNVPTIRMQSEQDNLIIFGDLHGNFRDLKHIIDLYGIPGDKYQFLFNGDFVDRGEQQVEVLMTLLYAFILNPTRVFFNRGNHEDYVINKDENFEPTFYSELQQKYLLFDEIYEKSETLFSHIPLATIVENKANARLFVVHGGISSRVFEIDFVQKINRSLFKVINTGRRLGLKGDQAKHADLISDMLWSDPIQLPLGQHLQTKGIQATGETFNVFRNLGTLFGYDITKKFLKKNNFDYMIRSHEVRELGFTKDHDGCYTLFSASGYGDRDNNGSILMLDYKEKMFNRYEYFTTRKSTVKHFKSDLRSFKQLLEDDKNYFLKKFIEKDDLKSGRISLDQWSSIIKELLKDLNVQHLLEIKDYLGTYNETSKEFNYESMFQHQNASVEQNDFIHKDIFKHIDLDKNELISLQEAGVAFESLRRVYTAKNNKLLKKTQEVGVKFAQFIQAMDFNKDQNVDLNEFREYLCLPNL